MTPAQLISRKRDGEELSDLEIGDLIRGYVDGEVPDYQMSAFAMAVYFRGMTTRETIALTQALLASGETLKWADSIAKVDKHSTGGLGDKVSLVLAPIMACCGLQVPMLSGRGLGITGGTLDKLESIPGFRTNLSIEELQAITATIGCAITGTTAQLAPADRKLYALRDVTGTVPSQPLIVASIMSKKLAENLDSLVLDVKCGNGAFMKHQVDATSLAKALIDVGSRMGVKTRALITNMHQPLGRMVGNALEVREAIETLQGGGPPDVLELTIRLGCELLLSEAVVDTEKAAHRLQLQTVMDGTAYQKFEQMVTAQGGQLDGFDLAKRTTVTSQSSGYLHAVDTALLGNSVIGLGGGRKVVTDSIDHGVGLEVLARVGNRVDVGQPLVHVFARSEFDADELRQAFVIDESQCEELPLVYDRIG